MHLASRRRRRGHRDFPEHRRRRWWDGWQPGIWIVLGLSLVLGYSLLAWLWPGWIAPLLLRTVPARPAPLLAEGLGEGLVLREEEVLRAPLAGRFRPEVEDGEWVLGQQAVATVGETVVVAPRSGIVRFSWDGQETLWAASELERAPHRPQVAQMGGSVGALLVRRESGAWVRGGDPIGRLVQPAGATLFAWLSATAAGWLPPPGSSVTVVAYPPGEADSPQSVAMATAEARVQGWSPPAVDGGEVVVQLRLSSLPESLLDTRLIDVKLVTTVTGSGRVVPLSSLWVRHGRLGLFLRPAQGGMRPLWTPVKLLAVWSERAQVAATRAEAGNTAWTERMAAVQVSPGSTGAAGAAWQRRMHLLKRLGQLVALSGGAGQSDTNRPAPPIPDGPFATWLGLEDGLAAVEGVPAGARVVTNPGWAVRWQL
ncbi:MAG: hypothetical protein IMX00_04820 [Limnochordales bacterium]|nr:hypothetical protein [Limnochordales bacterium]